MRKILISSACALALAAIPLSASSISASAQSNFVKGLIGGAIAGAVIGSIVRAGQNHCHPGLGCHSHGYANANHYHQSYGGPILYYQPAVPVAPAPPPVQAGYPQAHYDWCFNKYQSYDAASNTFQPYGGVPRRPCFSPYVQ